MTDKHLGLGGRRWEDRHAFGLCDHGRSLEKKSHDTSAYDGNGVSGANAQLSGWFNFPAFPQITIKGLSVPTDMDLIMCSILTLSGYAATMSAH